MHVKKQTIMGLHHPCANASLPFGGGAMGFTVMWGDIKIRCQTVWDVVSVVGELRGSRVAQQQSDDRLVRGTNTDEAESSHSSIRAGESGNTPLANHPGFG